MSMKPSADKAEPKKSTAGKAKSKTGSKHPKREELALKFKQGDSIIVHSSNGGEVLMDVDFRTHHAWSKDNDRKIMLSGRGDKFKNRYSYSNVASKNIQAAKPLTQ